MEPKIPAPANHFTFQNFPNLPKLDLFFYSICISWEITAAYAQPSGWVRQCPFHAGKLRLPVDMIPMARIQSLAMSHSKPEMFLKRSVIIFRRWNTYIVQNLEVRLLKVPFSNPLCHGHLKYHYWICYIMSSLWQGNLNCTLNLLWSLLFFWSPLNTSSLSLCKWVKITQMWCM